MDESISSLGAVIMMWVVWSSGFAAAAFLPPDKYKTPAIAVYIFLTGLVMHLDGKGII